MSTSPGRRTKNAQRDHHCGWPGRGDAGNDTLAGEGGANLLIGELLIGELGAMTGGTGPDLYRYNAPNEGGDTIVAFAPGADKFSIVKAGFGIPVNIGRSASPTSSSSAAPRRLPTRRTASSCTTPTRAACSGNGSAAGGLKLIATLNTALVATDFELR